LTTAAGGVAAATRRAEGWTADGAEGGVGVGREVEGAGDDAAAGAGFFSAGKPQVSQ